MTETNELVETIRDNGLISPRLARQIAGTLAPILTRRDRETWNRAIEAAVTAIEAWFPAETIDAPKHTAWKTVRNSIASLKDQGHG